MAKFCGNCGAQCDDAARVCGNCGTALEIDANTNANANAGGNAFAAKGAAALGGIKGLIEKPAVKIGAIAAAALVVLIILISIIPGLFPPKSIENKLVRAIKKDDPDAIVELVKDDSQSSAKEYIKSELKSMKSKFKDACGSDYKYSVKIIDTMSISAKDANKFYDSDEDYDWSKARQGMLKFTVKGNGKTMTYYGYYVMYKEDGKWSLGSVSLP
ncbi:MAG: zinc ribbon domain-containing protein [Clostridia bacterium]|nr:zinc ribbon domain-containing protein [Clostridia bacterium]